MARGSAAKTTRIEGEQGGKKKRKRVDPKTRAQVPTRGLALFIGLFVLVNLVGQLLGHGTNQNIWWIDYSLFTYRLGEYAAWATLGAQLVFGLLLVLWAARPNAHPARKFFTVLLLVVNILVAVSNVISYWMARASGELYRALPVPFSLLIVIVLVWLVFKVTSRPRSGRRADRMVPVIIWAIIVALVFPCLQIGFFGTTDYRRDADCIVVFGARVYSDGTLSRALSERMDTAIALYREGRAPVLIVSGGTDADGVSEADGMLNYAVSQGVPVDNIVVDRAGSNTDESVENTLAIARDNGYDTILATSSFYHLPRIKMMYLFRGKNVYTVPTVGALMNNGTRAAFPREIPAWWYYWLRSTFLG